MSENVNFAEITLEPGFEPVVISYADFTVGDIPYTLPVFVLLRNSQAQDLVSAGYQMFRVANYYTDSANTGQMLYKIIESPILQPISLSEPVITMEDVRAWRIPEYRQEYSHVPPPLVENPYSTPRPDLNHRPSYLTEEQIVSDLEYLILGHIEQMTQRCHRNSNSTQRAEALLPLAEYVHNISRIITERLTEMEIEINGRKRKIIRKDDPEVGGLTEGLTEGLSEGFRAGTRSGERSSETGRITDTNGSLPRPSRG